MVMLSSRVPPGCESAHGWCQLDTTLRHQAIAVMAPMAYNMGKTPSVSSQQASENAHAPPRPEAAQCARDASRSGLCPPIDPQAGARQHRQYSAPVSTRPTGARRGMAGGPGGRHGPRSGPFRRFQERAGRLCIASGRSRSGARGSGAVVRRVSAGALQERLVSPYRGLCLQRSPGDRRRWGLGPRPGQ
jgi:hypothetical protein